VFRPVLRGFLADSLSGFDLGLFAMSSTCVCVYRYMRDSLMEYARTVVIPLEHGIGRYIRVQLEFDSRWMLISEVQFQSGRWRHLLSAIRVTLIGLL